VQVAVDVMVEADATFNISSWYQSGTVNYELSLSTNGTWAFGGSTGPIDFAPNKWHKLAVQWGSRASDGSSWQAAFVNGVILANTTSHNNLGFNIRVTLDRYVFASMDNFAVTAMP
jgi:hypothetical protein